jgi:hypothetical protein
MRSIALDRDIHKRGGWRMTNLSALLDKGRKIPVCVAVADALSRTRRRDGRKINNAVHLTLFIQQIQYWLDKAEENRRLGNDGMKSHLDENGRLWVYNGLGGWKRNFPFWNEDTIRRLRNELVELGIILVQERGKDWSENPAVGMSTTWYSIDYEALDALEQPADNPADGQNEEEKEEISSLNLEGDATCEGEAPSNLQGGTPGNLPPHHRVLSESNLESSRPAGAAPAATELYDKKPRREKAHRRTRYNREEKSEKRQEEEFNGVGTTNLQVLLSKEFHITDWPKSWQELLNKPMTNQGKPNEDGLCAEALYDQSEVFRSWVTDELIPWMKREKRPRKILCSTIQSKWDWWIEYREEHTGTPRPSQKNKRDVATFDHDDPMWDQSNFDFGDW